MVGSIRTAGYDSRSAELLREMFGEAANIAVTVFDLKNEEYARDLLRERNVKYTKNNESIEQLLSQRRQVPKAMASNAFEKIIAEYEKLSRIKIPYAILRYRISVQPIRGKRRDTC